MSGEMPDKVALLRGVNVGGRTVIMADLRATAQSLGWGAVATYIASGNLLFRAVGHPGDLAAALEAGIARDIGPDVEILVQTAPQIAKALAECPFAQAPGNQAYAYFCWTAPDIDTNALAALRASDEDLVVRGTVVWLLTPSGFAASAVAANIGKVVRGTRLTARNLNTMRAVAGRLSAGGA